MNMLLPRQRRRGLALLAAFATLLASAVVPLVNAPPAAASTSYRDAVLADHPNAYWRLDEAAGNAAADQTGVNPATYSGGVTLGTPSPLVTDDTSRAATFNGTNGFLSAADSPSLDATAAVTIETWVKRAKSGWQVLVGKPGDGQSKRENYSLWLDPSNSAIAYFGDGKNYVRASTPALDLNWHHVVATYDNATARMYLDGALVKSATSSVQLTPNTGALNIGRAGDGTYFYSGSLDEVAIYPTALSAARIKSHFDAATTEPPAPDTTPPAVTLTAPAAGSTLTDPTPTFAGAAGTATGDSTTVTVKVYAGTVASGTPVQTLTTTRSGSTYSVDAPTRLDDGTYTAQAEQYDDATNLGQSSANTFTMAAGPPDLDPPDTTITSGPSGAVNTASASFAFTSTEIGSTFACDLDGQGYNACTSPAGYSGLTEGPHTFSVRATDGSGNTDPTPASRSWTVDRTAPTVTLTQPANGTSMTDTTPTFAGQAGVSDGDAAGVTVNVYTGTTPTGAPVASLAAARQGDGTFSVDATTALAVGTYTARASQTDAASNTGLSSPTTFAITAGGSATPYRDEVMADSPAAYWRLGEVAGTTAADETGANPGTYAGVTLGASGALVSEGGNTAATFDGVSSYASAPDSATLDAATSVSVEAWVKRAKSASWQVVVGKAGNGQSRLENYAIWFNTSDQAVAYLGDGTSYVSVASDAIDTGWHHIVATYDNATARIYVDGTLVRSVSSSIQLTPNAGAVNIGRAYDNTYFFGGSLDEVAVYPTALSGARVKAHFDAATSPTLDSTPPTVTLLSPANGSTTDDTTPTVSGTAGTAPGDSSTVTVNIYAGTTPSGSPLSTLTATRQSDGTYAATPSTALDPGTYTARAEQGDTAGNTGYSGASTFDITTQDVTAPVVSILQPANGVSTSDTPTISGTAGTAATDSTTVTVQIFSGTGTAGAGVQTLTTTRSGTGAWSVVAAHLDDGVYTVQASQADEAGNVGTSSANTFTVGATYRNDVMADQPVGYWRLGEASGTAAVDQTGANPGTYAGSPSLGRPGGLVNEADTAVLFDGVDDRVSVPDSNSLDASTAVTVEVWVKRAKSSAYQVIVAKPGNGQSKLENYALWLNSSNQVVAYFGNGSSYVSVNTGAGLDTAWHHVVATYDNATAKLYLDGNLTASATSSVKLTPNTGPLNIGRANNGSYPFGGTLDEVAVYRTALTATRIRTHYASGTGTPLEQVTLSSPAEGSSTANARPTFAGMASIDAGDATTVTVRVYPGTTATGTPVQTLTTSRLSTGVWNVAPTSGLGDGTYTAQAEQLAGTGFIVRSTASTFTVAPRAASSDPLFVGAGDIANCGSPGDEATAALLDQVPSATVFTLGDNAYDNGSAAEYANCYDPSWGRAKARTRPSLGDHDYADGGNRTASGYMNYFQSQLTPFGAGATDPTRGYYSYDLGSWHVVTLNGACEYSSAGAACHTTQVTWLDNDLAASSAACTVVLLHSPRFSSGSIHGNNTSMNPYWDVFYRRGVELVVSGDDHDYERFAPQTPQGAYDPNRGVRQLTVGTGGGSHYAFSSTIQPNSEIRNDTAYGVIKLGLHANSYEWDFLAEAGSSFTDSGSGTCH